MGKKLFVSLVFLMSLCLIGIIFVQSYWINTSIQNSEDQFATTVIQVLESTSKKIEKQERNNYFNRLGKLIDSLGKLPSQTVISELNVIQKDISTNEAFLYRSGIIEQKYKFSTNEFLEGTNNDSITLKKVYGKSETTFFDELGLDQSKVTLQKRIDRVNQLPEYSALELEEIYKTLAEKRPIHKRVSKKQINLILAQELFNKGLNLEYEFAIYSNDLATSVHSKDYELLKDNEYVTSIFQNNSSSNFNLRLAFPNKKKFLLDSMLSMVVLSIAFTGFIILLFVFVLYQLFRQRKISQIKTDFINNMTHEFKTPIATINLALDAIRNPKVIGDDDKVKRYLKMISEENKRMHAQVENVLRISRLEKKQLDIKKEKFELHDLIEDAIPHVELIVEDRGGKINIDFNAKSSSVLVNESHFTNVIVNILDNAIKYSVAAPLIKVSTENIRNSILLKISDNGIGMSKSVQKKIFEKFYREHTGNVHNVKGHGLGLAYVKQIIDDHQGEIFVESEKDTGTTFIIKLPLIS
jgi:two-component system, OmpR family, phosphate regulon sensor histidine kinase PhoR